MNSRTALANPAAEPAPFDDLFQRFSAAAWRLARSITHNPDDASDAVAEAFSKVFDAVSAGRVGRTDDLGPYVMAATRNAAIDIVRRAGRLEAGAAASIDRPETAAGPSDRLVAGEDRTLVAQAFAELPPRWRAVLWLTEVERMPPREAAAILRVTPNNMAQLAARARSRLRERYVQVHVRNHARGACLEVVEQLGRFAAGELPGSRARSVRAHLDGCADCRDRLAELEDLGLHLRRATIPFAVLARPRRRWLRGLASWWGRASHAARLDALPGGLPELAASPAVQHVVGAVVAGLLVTGVGGAIVTLEGAHSHPGPRPSATPAVAVEVPSPAPTGAPAGMPTTTVAEPAPTPTSTTVAAAAPPPAPPRAPAAPRLAGAVTTTVAAAVDATLPVFAAPGVTSPSRTLDNPRPSGAPLVLLVTEDRGDWLQVLLPVRPNGSTGWIRRHDVRLSTHDYRMTVELAAHRITVFRGAEVVLRQPVAVGTSDAPTPGGLYYTVELVQPVDAAGRYDPGGPYGPYAYGLSGFSDVLFEFAGGDGQFGIHGTNDPSTLGTDVSHGCIRMSNEGISALAAVLPLGVPVEVVA